jgi:hypothetical protein
MDYNEEELACQTMLCDWIFVQRCEFNMDCLICGSFRLWHRDIIYIQQYQHAITAKIEVGVYMGLSEPSRVYKSIDIVVP